MERAAPTIAGRQVPLWSGMAIRLGFTVALLGIASQVAELEATASSNAPAGTAVPAASSAAAPAGPAIRRLTIGRQLLHGEYVWDEAGAPPGRIEILVDLSAQTLSVIRGGHEIGRAVILYGTEGNPTPTGTFPILEKKRHHVSNLYEAIMPYMMRLTRDGIAIHGSNVRYGWASRGCVGVPDEFAALLFERARVGDVVTIVGGATAAAAPAPQRRSA